jgi:IS5 family transposase
VEAKGHKDEEATWAKKRNETHYGYKDNIKVDKDSKIITKFTVTTAKVRRR